MLKQIGQKIKNDVILTLIVLLGLRCLVDFNFAQALVFLCLSGSYCYMNWLKSQEKKDINDDVKRQLEEMKSSLSGVLMNKASKPQVMQQEIKRFF